LVWGLVMGFRSRPCGFPRLTRSHASTLRSV